MSDTLSPRAQKSARDLAARDGASGDVAVEAAQKVLSVGTSCWEGVLDIAASYGIPAEGMANFMLQKALATLAAVSAPATADLVRALVDQMMVVESGGRDTPEHEAITRRFQDAAERFHAVARIKAGASQ